MDAHSTVAALGGRWFGSYGMARCPAHQDEKPSLSVTETKTGKLLVKCHAGCRQDLVIRALQSLHLWPAKSNVSQIEPPLYSSLDVNKRTAAALKLWSTTSAAAGTTAERYLISRGITLPPPPALRFHRNLKHPTGKFLPAMVALVTDGIDGSPQAIHRTYLAPGDTGKAAVSPQRAMLGPCRGGVVRLAEPSEHLLVGEGIETCLAAMQLFQSPAWAALSASGLRALELPEAIREITIIADGDHAGGAAAEICANRWRQESRHVRIAHAPPGMDFNDVLISGVANTRNAA
jgi:hypothetical protein